MLTDSKVTDYTQLNGMLVRKLWINENLPAKTLATLRKIPTLTHINDQTVDVYWQTHP